MLRKDYIMRQFEEFGKVMAVILGLKKQNDLEKFEEEVANASQKFTTLNINYVEGLSFDVFEKEVLQSPTLLPDQQKMLADLLYEKMLFYLEKNENTKAFDIKNKCSALYTVFSENLTANEFNLDVHYKLEFFKTLNINVG